MRRLLTFFATSRLQWLIENRAMQRVKSDIASSSLEKEEISRARDTRLYRSKVSISIRAALHCAVQPVAFRHLRARSLVQFFVSLQKDNRARGEGGRERGGCEKAKIVKRRVLAP